MIHTNTTTWSHRWYWYVLVYVFGMYLFVSFHMVYKYTLIHTFTTGDLRAGSCVRTSRPKVPLGLLMYVSHCRQHQHMALGAFACSGRQPTGTFMLRGPATYWAVTFRAAARCDAALGGSDSAAVKPATLRACRKLHWPCRALWAKIGAALVLAHVCIGMYPYILVCINRYWTYIGMYVYVIVCIGPYWYVLLYVLL